MKKQHIAILLVLTSLIVTTGPGIALAHVSRPMANAAAPSREIPTDWQAAAQSALPQAPAIISGLPTAPDWSAESNQANARLGEHHGAAVGDFNGDGYDDVIVGARFYDSGATDSGRAYLFYGSAAGLSTTPDQVFDPPAVELNGFFGGPVASAGDVNNDGYDDLMIGMVNYNNTTSDEGAVFVWYGSASGPGTTYDWMARGNALYAHFGESLGTAGDVNGDGYDDIIVGAYRYDINNVSHAYVWHGSASGLGPDGTPANADWTASAPTGTANGHAFGTQVGTAGDVNKDGYADVFVGAPLYDNGETDEGGVFVWYGSASGLGPDGTLANADWMAEGNQAEANLGRASAAGDVNGDGYDDFVASAINYDNGQTNEGAAFGWYGSASGLGTNGTPANADWTVESNQDNAQFGFDVGAAGDVNDDGYDDVIVGARYYDNPETSEGAAFVYYGSAAGPSTTADWTGESDQASALMGFAVGTAGDVNGDNVADVLVSAPYYDNPEENEGRVFVYHGSSDAPPPPPPPPSTGSFTFYAIYDRLQVSPIGNTDLTHAAMSGDGQKLVFSGVHQDTRADILWTVNADGSNMVQVPMPTLGVGRDITSLAINRDGSRAFFSVGGPPYDELYKVEGGAVTKIFDSDDYGAVNGVYEIQTTADGDYVYFIEDRDDLWRVGHSGGAPTQVIDDAAVPRDGGTGAMIIEFDVSADGSTVAFILNGYRDGGGAFSYKREVFALDGSTYRQLTNDSGDVIKEELTISGDGTTVVYGASAPQWTWYSIRSDGSAKIPLEDMAGNFGGLALTYDGTRLFYYDDGANGGRLTNTDGSGALDLFPGYPIELNAPKGLCISEDGSRVSFRTPELYVGYLNDPDAVPSAPEIENIAFDPSVMPKDDPSAQIIVTSHMADPQGLADIVRVSTDEVVDGQLADYADLPVEIPFWAHDDGASPDQTADDGVYSTFGRPGQKIAESDQMTVRMSAQDDSATVVVADTTLLIGSAGQMPLLPPTNLRAQPGVNSIELTWDPSTSPGLAGYNVYRSTSPDSGFTKINASPVTGDRYLDATALVPGTTYFYYLTAVDSSSNESDPSNLTFAVFGQVKLFIPDSHGAAGSSVILPVNIANADGLGISGCDIWVAFDSTILSAVAISETILTEGYNFATNTSTPGVVRASIATTSGPTLYGEGSLFQILFNVVGSADETSELAFDVGGTFVFDNDVNPVALDLTDIGVFTVDSAFILGDLNGDGLVTEADADIVLQIAVGNLVPSPKQRAAGDVNGDGRINSGDAVLILRMAAGSSLAASMAEMQALRAPRAGTVTLTIPDDTTAPQGDSAWVPLSIDDATGVVGADIVLNYDPFIATAIGARTTALSANFDVQFNIPVAGQAKISLKPKAGYEDGLAGGSGGLVEILFAANSAADVGSTSPLNLASVRLSDRYGRDFATSALQVQMNTDSGILTVEEGGYFTYLPLVLR